MVPKKLKICEFGSMLNLKQSPSLILAILLSAAAASAQTGISVIKPQLNSEIIAGQTPPKPTPAAIKLLPGKPMRCSAVARRW